MIRTGKVTHVDTNKQKVRVLFSDLDQTTSNDLPIVYPFTVHHRVAKVPQINEDVVCVFLENNSDGFCVGSYITENTTQSKKEHFTFSDGTMLEYDTETHELVADVKGTAVVKAENIIIEGNITLKGAVTVTGDITFVGGVNCPNECKC